MQVYSNLIKSCIIICCFFISNALCAQGTKLSQFDKGGYSDVIKDKAGVLHAVFQETPGYGKSVFIYYASSANNGKTWTKPVTLSRDKTGNASGAPKILQDKSGKIYAIWKRYGLSSSAYPVQYVLLDGPGGETSGTLFYKVLSGGAWSEQVMLNEVEGSQTSWFATVDNYGDVRVVWAQASDASIKSNWTYYYYNDYVREVTLAGNIFSPYETLNEPSAPGYVGGAPPKNGWLNLDGYYDKNNKLHMLYEKMDENSVEHIMYKNGDEAARSVYQYPKYNHPNTFMNPPKLLFDEKGNDHLVFRPASSVLEQEEIWDIELNNNDKQNVLAAISKKGVTIQNFNAAQGPNGMMAAVFSAGGLSESNEAFGVFYNKGKWTNLGLTKNAAKNKFFYKEFPSVYTGKAYLSTLTKYYTNFIDVAYDKAGKRGMLMTIAAYTSVGGAFSVSEPAVRYISID